MSREEGFLTRWSRRKVEAGASTAAPEEQEQPGAPAAAILPAVEEVPSGVEPDMLRDPPPDEETRQAWVEKLEAINLDALTYNDDFTVFMKSWVPQALRNRALRRLWRTNDVLAVLDGLNDYDEDFSIAPAAIGAIKSSWQPGRGFALAEPEDDQHPAAGSEPEADVAGGPAEAAGDAQPASEATEAAQGGEEAPPEDDRAAAQEGKDADDDPLPGTLPG